MAVADLPQAFQVAGRRRDNARGTGYGFDDDGRDVAAVMQRTEPLEVIGQFDAVRGQPA